MGLSADVNLYRYNINNPIIFVDPFGLENRPTGGTVVSGDPGVQMLIDSYLREANGNAFAAWDSIVGHREKGIYGKCDIAASAEHYLWALANSQVSLYGAFQQSVSIPPYQGIKLGLGAMDMLGTKTPASLSQFRWSYQGVIDGRK